MQRQRGWTAAGAIALSAVTGVASAQETIPGQAPPQPTTPQPITPPPGQPAAQPGQVDINSLPPQVKIGLRVELARQTLHVRPVVVVVSSAAAYADAVSRWSLQARWPVLIDDGSDRTREDIARFVRAFRPERVVLWASPGQPWPDAPDARRRRLADAAARAWNAEDADALKDQWARIQFVPPGVVVMNDADPAWTGGLALAAGRGQPIIWVDRAPAKVGAMMDAAAYDALAGQVRAGVEASGYAFARSGDAIESITAALNVESRVQRGGDKLALTDLLGRAQREGDETRWAFAGLAFGDEAGAAYRAMAALFLMPQRAWLFNGYDLSGPFASYALPPAVEPLRQRGLSVHTEADPQDGLGVWRRAASSSLDAGLVHVNSAGIRWFFRLRGDEAHASEIPLLARPAVVHFVHSFSAQEMDDRTSIAPRWIEHGAYAYVGAMDEPFLTAFHTPEVFAKRFSAAPLGIAARVESPQPWKVNVFGDPLITLGPPATRLQGPDIPELDGAEDLEERMKNALRERRLADAVAALVVLGRDADAVRVFQSAAADPASMTPDLAAAAFWPAARSGLPELAAAAFLAMDPARRAEPVAVDALWRASRFHLENASDRAALTALRGALRQPTIVDDATTIARAVRRLDGSDAARAFLNGVINSPAADEPARERLRERLRLF